MHITTLIYKIVIITRSVTCTESKYTKRRNSLDRRACHGDRTTACTPPVCLCLEAEERPWRFVDRCWNSAAATKQQTIMWVIIHHSTNMNQKIRQCNPPAMNHNRTIHVRFLLISLCKQVGSCTSSHIFTIGEKL